jgi:DNA-binding response OmpR family regulator
MTNEPELPVRRRRLLAVDDNRLILRVIRDFFVPKGWEVTTAENVAVARRALRGAAPDVIVSDILMPEVDGWTFFEDVRKREETASVPFVFLTVERDLPKRLRGLHLGADDYMTKPFAVEELYARIVRLLARSAALKNAGSDGSEALLAGSVAHLAISDLLQILALNAKDGTVRLHRQDGDGRIEFVGGRIVDAQVGSAHGTKALFRMLSWADATFRVMAREGEVAETTITAATATVLMEGLVSLDDWARWRELLPGPQSRIELAADARSRLHGIALRPVEFDLLARSKTGITVARALEDSPHPDAAVAEAICSLLARGVVRTVPEASEAETAASL